ncbi:MAG: permease-like cell division protein FtsX [Candidatus Pacebacteria bacterium]|nr:permease-like cell division protein FtsX [Candidatus Paceibacterota bacterium]
MFLVIYRTFKESLTNFWRNGWLSIAAVSVLLLSLYVVGTLYVTVVTADNVLGSVESRINISVYFKSDATEDQIMQAKSQLESNNEVKSVEYISKDQALSDFKASNANEPVIMQSLQEIGGNPLLASLVIKANDPNNYQDIANYVSSASFKDQISRVNYAKNKDVIDNLNSVVGRIKKVGSILAIIFGVVSILIIFNTIRITIYTHRQEIEVMRLVGAGNTYIRLPFLFEGVIYGLVATILATILLYITVQFVSPYAASVLSTESLTAIYLGSFWPLVGLQLLFGTLLGVVSSLVAMRKYLKI